MSAASCPRDPTAFVNLAASPETSPTGDEPEDATSHSWGIGHALAGFVVANLLAAVAVGAVIAGSGASGDGTERSLAGTLAGLGGLWLGFVGAAVVASRQRGTGSVLVDFGLWFRPIDIPVGIIVGLACQQWLVWLIYQPLRLLDPNVLNRVDDAAEQTLGVARGPGFAVLAVAIVVGVPVVEELFFRGLLQAGLVGRLGRTGGVAFASLAFGLAHFQALQTPALVAFGAVLGVLTLRTGRLGAAVVAHAAFDGAAVLGYYLTHR
jgi:membrane protease YdiL (CAAX protease family)